MYIILLTILISWTSFAAAFRKNDRFFTCGLRTLIFDAVTLNFGYNSSFFLYLKEEKEKKNDKNRKFWKQLDQEGVNRKVSVDHRQSLPDRHRCRWNSCRSKTRLTSTFRRPHLHVFWLEKWEISLCVLHRWHTVHGDTIPTV